MYILTEDNVVRWLLYNTHVASFLRHIFNHEDRWLFSLPFLLFFSSFFFLSYFGNDFKIELFFFFSFMFSSGNCK